MQNTTLILTEQRRLNDEHRIYDILQRSITAWLKKELYK